MAEPNDTILKFVTYVATASDALAVQAGVGGMETAGGIISYLAKHPDQLDAFLEKGVFGWSPDWIENGCLTWHATNGKIVHPDELRAHRAEKASAKEEPPHA